MTQLHEGGGLRQHRFAFKGTDAKPSVYTKPHIFEAELDDAAVPRLAPQLAPTLHGLELQAGVMSACPSLGLLPSPDAAAVKLQCNEGGGSFPTVHVICSATHCLFNET